MSIVYRIVTFAFGLMLLAVPRPAVAEQITVTHWGVLMYGAPYAVAIEKGYYKDAGLNIDGVLTSKGGGTTMRNVMASDLPYGEVALSAVIAAMKQGIDLKIIHTGVRTAGEILWVTTPDSGINSVKDLAGKKVAFTSPKSVTDMLLTMVMDKHKIKAETVAAGGIGSGLTMVQQKGVVAAPVMDPIWSKMQSKFKPVFHVADELPPMVQTVGVTTTEYAKANKDKLHKLVQARKKAVQFVYANPEETAKIVAKHYNADEKVILNAVKNLSALKYWGSGEFEYPAMDNMVKGLQIIGEVDGKIDWAKVVDESFVK
ncbi:MAG: ABC transporter substrate-binding protein [Pseudorhodoplanes sp.]|jgi:NitT/TauT family transport system substrate-binding protein|nr:ABC transporter substrate-binding protein [Pseudorhodoplanes sp.]